MLARSARNPITLNHKNPLRITQMNLQIEYNISMLHWFYSTDVKCDFDDGTLCNRCSQAENDDFDLIIRRGSTSSGETGPSRDRTSASGTYNIALLRPRSRKKARK